MRAAGGVGSREVAAVLLRSWLAKLGIPARRFGLVVTGVLMVLAAVSTALALLARQLLFFEYPPEVFGFTLIGVHVFATFLAILSSAATAQRSPAMAWWQASPLSDRRLGRGLSIPVWALAGAEAIVTAPSIVAMFGKGTYLSYFQAAALYGVALGTGVVVGRFLLVAGKLACRKISRQLADRAQVAAVPGALLYTGMALYVTSQVVAVPGEGQSALPWMALGYPLLFSVTADGSVWAWLGLSVWVALLCCVEVWLWPRSGLEKYDGAKIPTLGLACRSRGRMPVFRLELLRLIRYPRAQEFLLSGFLFQLFPLILYLKFDLNFLGPADGDASAVIMVGACIAGFFPVIARGLSGRQSPYARMMGLMPQRWALAVNLGAVLLSLAVTLPFVAVWVILLNQLPYLVIGLTVILFAAALAGVVGSVMVPTSETGVAETVSVLMPFVGTVMTIGLLQRSGLEDPGQFGPVLLVVGMFLLFVPCVVEALRWNGVDVGDKLREKASR